MLEFGFPEEESRVALTISNNNIENAAELASGGDLASLKALLTMMAGDEAPESGAGVSVGVGNEGPPKSEEELKQEASLINEWTNELQTKMVILVRADLRMGVGKVAAQVGHAVLGAYKQGLYSEPALMMQWEAFSWPKIVLRVNSEKELMEKFTKANEAKVNAFLVQDAGRTQVDPGTKTVLALGPALNKQLQPITGSLKLL